MPSGSFYKVAMSRNTDSIRALLRANICLGFECCVPNDTRHYATLSRQGLVSLRLGLVFFTGYLPDNLPSQCISYKR